MRCGRLRTSGKVWYNDSMKRSIGATEYAWVGDAVMTAYVRERLVRETDYKTGILQKKSKQFVSAVAQARFLELLAPTLSEEERDVCRRGRNAHTGHTAKNATGEEYRAATALETLLGWLWLEGRRERLSELLDRIFEL